ncbi:hypothetical protein DID88_007740 [Monilinia fructigena]|uniref:Transmembrane 9 superfamily member n=1 Tax=Monilinia fructigena TaxID=38457 RepID=A0A395J483_9HELO|nr:hypothetical protein DID88_007740 [Monilinia fructigena]
MHLKDFTPSAALLATLFIAPELTSAFYLPGVAPTSYTPGAKVPLYVNRLTPVGSYDDGQLRSVGFALNWLVDGLPAGQLIEDEITQTRFYSQGFALGSSDQKDMHLNNHYDIFIDYHEVSTGQMRVVGVIVQPSSRTLNQKAGNSECGAGGPKVVLSESGETAVTYSYSVWWQPSTTAWATRWDKYLHVFDPKIHWFSLINSAVIVVFLVITVLSILMRTLRKDIQRYNRLDSINLDDLSGTSAAVEDGVQEDSGWKLVHGDVFRFTIAFALLGFLSPSNRGSLGTIMILLYTVLGFIGGYASARVYKSFGGEQWKLKHCFDANSRSRYRLQHIFPPQSLPLGQRIFWSSTIHDNACNCSIWFFFSVPLSFAGSWVGFRQPPIASPSALTKSHVKSLLLLPICVRFHLCFSWEFCHLELFFVELYFIMSSIWFSKVYYMFGFLFLCYGLMIITCAAVTVLMIYLAM